MANKHKGECSVELGGRTYTLRPSFEAIVEFEDRAGCSSLEALRAFTDSRSAPIKTVAAAFTAGIKYGWDSTTGEKPPTYSEVGQMIRAGGVINSMVAFGTFITNTLCSEADLEQMEKAAAGEGKT